MKHTHLFNIEWDNSYGDPDFGIPWTFFEWMKHNEDKRERLAQHLEWLAKALRNKSAPFHYPEETARTERP